MDNRQLAVLTDSELLHLILCLRPCSPIARQAMVQLSRERLLGLDVRKRLEAIARVAE